MLVEVMEAVLWQRDAYRVSGPNLCLPAEDQLKLSIVANHAVQKAAGTELLDLLDVHGERSVMGWLGMFGSDA